jgi:hypothetical protein
VNDTPDLGSGFTKCPAFDVLQTDYKRDGTVSTGYERLRKPSIHRHGVRICHAEPTSDDDVLNTVEDR